MPFKPTLRNVYLLAYNLAQSILWLHTLALLIRHVPAHLRLPATSILSPSSIALLYTHVSPSALLAQRLSWLEVVHAAAGLAGGGVGAAFVQALGRSTVLLVLVEKAATARGSVCAPLLIAAAAGSDLVRYVFYVAGLLEVCPRWLMVVRYSTFLLAYPVSYCIRFQLPPLCWLLLYLCFRPPQSRYEAFIALRPALSLIRFLPFVLCAGGHRMRVASLLRQSRGG